MTYEERQKEKAYIREMKALGKLIKKYPESISPDMQEKIAEYYIWKNYRSARFWMKYSILSFVIACVALLLNIIVIIVL